LKPRGIDALFQTIPGERNGEALESTAVSEASAGFFSGEIFPSLDPFLSGEE
jgi:hypothetical protein